MSVDLGFYWDEKWPLLRLKGEGCRAFLQGQTTSDIFKREEGVIFSTCWLNAIGRLRALLEVRLDIDGANIVVLSGNMDQLIKGFEQVIFPSDKVNIDSLETVRRMQIITSKKPEILHKVFWLEVSMTFPEDLNGFTRATKQQIEHWRLEQGLPIGEGEINGDANPFELGLADLVDLNKGCYLGQEVMAKISRAPSLKKELRFWQANSKVSQGQVLVSSSSQFKNQKAGVITSAMEDPISGNSVGLALIRRQALSEKQLCTAANLRSLNIRKPSGFSSLMS